MSAQLLFSRKSPQEVSLTPFSQWRIAMLKTAIAVAFVVAAASGADYKVLAPTTQDNLTVFPIVSDTVRDTGGFLTLDEGIRSGQVVVAEEGSSGMVRPRHRPSNIPDPWP